MSRWTPILEALKITDEHDRERTARARKDLVRWTVVPRVQTYSAKYELLDRAEPVPNHVEMIRMRAVSAIHDKLTADGYVASEAVIAGNLREDTDAIGMMRQYRWTFPRPYPDTGDPARIAGGPDHGDRFEVPATWDRVVLPVYLGTRPSTDYVLHGFDAATGQWVYTPENGRA